MAMRVRSIAGIAAALLVAAGALTYAFVTVAGLSDRPETSSPDAGFARDMAVHHQQAVDMSYIIRDRTADKDVRFLAYDIAQTQANQRGMLLGWLDLWDLSKVSPDGPMAWMGMDAMHSAEEGSLMPGMATKVELKRLESLSGRKAENLFLQLMTAHHKGGVHMADSCARTCTVDAVKRLAQHMVNGQRSEIDVMRDMLTERGAKPRA